MGNKIRWDKKHKLDLLEYYVPKMRGGLGFKNLRDFNLAMLGKQGWKLVSRPDSLIARVLKAKYYEYTVTMKSDDIARKKKGTLSN